MRWSIRIFNIPPPRATPCVQIPAPWGQNCVQIPTQVLDLIKNFFLWKARSATLTNSCQPFLLSHLLSACESEFFTLKHPHIKSQNTSIQLGRLAKSASNCPLQSDKVQILYPPRHGWQTKKLWVALKGGCWSFKLIGTLLGIKL